MYDARALIQVATLNGQWSDSEDGKTIYCWGLLGGDLAVKKWMSEEDIEKMRNDREPFQAPVCPYKIQPENQGRLVWLSGPPGAGKSTTAQMLGKEAGYLYYEADAIMNYVNPFIPLDAKEATLAMIYQKGLKVLT